MVQLIVWHYFQIRMNAFSVLNFLYHLFSKKFLCSSKNLLLLKHCKQFLQKSFLNNNSTTMFFFFNKRSIHFSIFFIWYIDRINQIIFITKHIDTNIFLFSSSIIFFRYRKFSICIIKIINYFFFVILSGCIFNGFKYLIWHQAKHLFSLFLIFINLFIAFFHLSCNLMYELADNGLLIEILTYSPFLDLIIQPDSSLIQLSIKNIFRINSSRIKVNRNKFFVSILFVFP